MARFPDKVTILSHYDVDASFSISSFFMPVAKEVAAVIRRVLADQ